MAIQTFELDPNAVSTGEQARDLIVGLADLDWQLVITRPDAGEFPVVAVNGTPGPGASPVKLEVEYDDQPVV